MADIGDKANDDFEQWMGRVLSQRRRYEGESATACVECDEPIPEARRVALPGVRLCVHCQWREERRDGR